MASDRIAVGPTVVITIKTLVVFAAFLTCLCLTSAAAASGRLFPTGVQYEYEFRSTVFADGSSGDEGARGSSGPIGHRTVGRLSVASLWSAAADEEKLLRLHVSTYTHIYIQSVSFFNVGTGFESNLMYVIIVNVIANSEFLRVLTQ